MHCSTKGFGVASENCDPYTEGPGMSNYSSAVLMSDTVGMCSKKCTDKSTPTLYTAADIWSTALTAGTAANVKAIQQELVDNGPLEVGITIMGEWASYKKGIYKLTKNDTAEGGHAVQLIGWGTGNTGNEVGVDYWLVQNSWGDQWGEKGYVRMSRGTNELGIEQEAIAGMPVV
jgi:hypothetical protein